MKKTLLVVIVLGLCAATAWSRSLHAGPGKMGLREALALAQPFDTVFVHGGEYRDTASFEITRPLTLIGLDWPLLDGANRLQPLSVRSNYVSVSGFRVANSPSAGLEDYAGIKVYNARYVYIWGNRLENNYFGIYLSNCVNCVVTGNHLQASGTVEQTSGNGVHAWKCDSLTITDNFAAGHRDGIYFEFVTNSFIRNNHSEGNLRYGLHFMFSHNDHYENNTFYRNGAGVAVMYSRRVTMHGNRFLENQGSSAYGILLKDISDSQMTDNEFQRNTTGIYMEGCSRCRFEHNTFRQNGWAIKLQASCDGNLFTRNNFWANTFDIATNNALVLNTLESNFWDKYEGYDLARDGVGDVPYRPVSLYARIAEDMPYAMMLWRSFMVTLLDRAEKVIPSLTPENLRDDTPSMKAL
ncbi:MAG: nitrous oxide reductase family maturation protein NosD [Saprospiraceae bacterium]|nr:nitrous oxide reductase family maturation protein NosD [Saprospiraceae bacterium]